MAKSIDWAKKAQAFSDAKSYDQLTVDEKKAFDTLGDTKGVYVSFTEGEIITFPPKEEAFYFLDEVKLANKKKQYTLKVLAESSVRGSIKFPVAAFRRVPTDVEISILEEKAKDSLTGVLMYSGLTDPQRLDRCFGRTIICSKVLPLHQASITWTATEGWKTVQPTTLKEAAKFGNCKCFIFNYCDE